MRKSVMKLLRTLTGLVLALTACIGAEKETTLGEGSTGASDATASDATASDATTEGTSGHTGGQSTGTTGSGTSGGGTGPNPTSTGPTTGSGECGVSRECSDGEYCVATWDGEKGPFMCIAACLEDWDTTQWCADDAACCDSTATCNPRGFCGDGSDGSTDTSTSG